MPRLSLLFLAVAALANADVVHLTNGGRVEGIVSDEGPYYKITTTAGVVRMMKEKVSSIEQKDCILAEYQRESAKVDEKDSEGHYRLALLCRDGKWTSKANEEAQKVLALDPDHEGAREMLGFVRYEGKWMTRVERYKAMGYLQYHSKWYPADVVRRCEARDAQIKFLRQEEDALNLALSHIAASDPSTRRHGADEFIDHAKRVNVADPEKTAKNLLAYYDDAWQRYVANDSTIGTIEIRATMVTVDEPLDFIDTTISTLPFRQTVHIETPRTHAVVVRTTVQVPMALHMTLVPADLIQQQGAPPSDVLGND